MNGCEVNGKKLEVNKHDKNYKKNQEGGAAKHSINNLFVKNFPVDTNDEQLHSMFSGFGEIESAVVKKDADGIKLKDYGYVCFKDASHAAAAIASMNKKVLPNGNVLIVNYFVSKKDNELGHGSRTMDPITQNLTQTYNSNLYVKFIPEDVDENQLREKFAIALVTDKEVKANILSIKLKKVENYQYKFAYVMYDSVQAAQRAIQRFDQQYVFPGSSKPLSVEMWVSKEEKELEKKRRDER